MYLQKMQKRYLEEERDEFKIKAVVDFNPARFNHLIILIIRQDTFKFISENAKIAEIHDLEDYSEEPIENCSLIPNMKYK